MAGPVQILAALPDQTRRVATEVASNVVSLPQRKRSPGRPEKAIVYGPDKHDGRRYVDRRCTDAFETVVIAIVGIAAQKDLFGPAKERARDGADKDNALSPCARRVFGYLISKMNRGEGYHWRSAEEIARELGVSSVSAKRALRELTFGGYVLRKEIIVRSKHGSRVWHTTVPALVAAAQEITAERETKAQRGINKSPNEGSEKAERGINKMRQRGIKNDPQTFIGEFNNQPARARIRAQGDLDQLPDEGSSLASGSPAAPEGAASGAPAATVGTTPPDRGTLPPPTQTAQPRLSARLDRTLPMTQRVSIPGGRWGTPQTDEDRELLAKLKRAARGWDLHDLRDKFCARHDTANTRDAMAGFEGWLRSYVQEPAPGYFER